MEKKIIAVENRGWPQRLSRLLGTPLAGIQAPVTPAQLPRLLRLQTKRLVLCDLGADERLVRHYGPAIMETGDRSYVCLAVTSPLTGPQLAQISQLSRRGVRLAIRGLQTAADLRACLAVVAKATPTIIQLPAVPELVWLGQRLAPLTPAVTIQVPAASVPLPARGCLLGQPAGQLLLGKVSLG